MAGFTGPTGANAASEDTGYEETDQRAALSFQAENDLFGDGSDRHYTNGLRISYMFPVERTPRFARVLRDKVPWLTDSGDLRAVLGWGQNLFTPSDITVPELLPDDRPYAGWLYTELGLVVSRDNSQGSFVISLGVVGPAALGQQTQSRWHRVISSPQPQGWDNQIRNAPAIMLLYQHEWQAKRVLSEGVLEVDISPRLGAALGNVFTYASAGAMVRIGPHLPKDFGAPRIRPSLPGSAYFEVRKGKLDWYLFGGVEGRLMARNVFLDGNMFRDSHSVDKRRTVWDMQFGAAMTLGFLNIPARVTYNFVYRSKEFVGQTKPDKFGSLSISLLY